MLFNSLDFLIFFPIVCLVYFAIPKKIKWMWLLGASYYFYMCWNPKYALLMFTSTVITWLSGYFIDKFNAIDNSQKSKLYKNITVAVSFVSNLAILFFFKYFDFAVENLNSILSLFNIKAITPSFDVVLPVGISFYTFQALSYTMDVYRKDVKCEKNLFRYMLFVSFFPQLVAGPIERSKNLIHQLNKNHSFEWEKVKSGLFLMLWGFFQKLVIADRAAIAVNTVYNNLGDFGGTEACLATVLFALQIYCDFSSYTDIARGASRIMGIELMENFKQPYFARSIAQFWRRWHMSLSGWFKDYLYIPLGGNRRGTVRKYINIMIVFFASGLWHGASWNFVIWGLLHGAYQILGGITEPYRNKLLSSVSLKPDCTIRKIIQIMCTFFLVCFGWIFFRANNMSDALSVIQKIFTEFSFKLFTDGSILNMGLDTANIVALLVATVLLFAVSLCHRKGFMPFQSILKTNVVIRMTLGLLFVFVILIFGVYGPGYSESQFIYFQF